MSVLLEALKKAAEDKKKALESSGQSSKVEASLIQEDTAEKNRIPESSIDSDDVLGSAFQNTANKPAEIKLSLNEGVALAPMESIKQPEIIKNTPPLAPKESPEIALKLDLSLGETQQSEKASDASKIVHEEAFDTQAQASFKLAIEGSTDQSDTSFDKSVPKETASLKAAQVITKQDNSLDDSTLRNIDLPDSPSIEPTVDAIKEASTASDLLSEKTKENKAVDLHLAKNNLDEVSTTPDLTKGAAVGVLKNELLEDAQGLPESKAVTVSHDATPTPIKTEIDRNGQHKDEVSDLEESSTQLHQHSAKPSTPQTNKNPLKEDEDSYKWSLDALPGYLGLGRKRNKKTIKASTDAGNPILVAGALSEDPARPSKRRSVKLIIILLVLLLLIGILFYGALYYQEQHDALEQRMKKYNLVKTHITVEEGLDTVNQQPEKRVESLDKNIVEGGSQIPLSEEAISIEAISKKSLVSNRKSDSLVENNQTREEVPSQSDVENSFTAKAAIPHKDISTSSLEKKMSNRIVNVPKTSTQILDKKVTEVESKAPRKAIIVVHSEEELLSDAYLSYGQGDFSRAQQYFEKVLTMNPKNEFALIGLGNILASDQQYAMAMNFYQKALAAQPSSLNAFEAIANISAHIELNSDWKKALSEMAQDYSESATLQYALGNISAEENDWLSAQSAYFQAVALEPDNADYLVNLAVSLDQLGKYQLAARYYTEALAFVDVEAVNFNEAQVKNRLISIRQFMAERVQ